MEIYFYFIKNLLKKIKSSGISYKKEVVFIMDNANIHESKYLKNFYLKRGITILFIPQYTPQFKFIEFVFCYLKNTIKKKNF
jgi:transposase